MNNRTKQITFLFTMARRRPPSTTNLAQSNMPTESPKLSKSQRHRPQPSVEQPNLGMSPEARYNHNLKVLRRRDPSIISIFDQFSHVCVYHHNGQTWEKNGFEGSMFLYERDSYPPYGFYILNRMGMDDYIQRLYPEDVTGIHGTYLMLRSYPAFTTRRLSHILSSHDEPPEKFSDVYSVPNLDKLLDGDKGRAHTVGLWMFPTDAREPMIDVMMRLHSYIKQNVPYPEQFRYGPNRPPPPNPHLRTTSPSPPPEPHAAPSGDHGLDRSFPSGSASELDKLFARLSSTPSAPTSVSHAPARKSTATMTVASLFAALGGADVKNPEPDGAPTAAPPSGIPLLDSIFASANAASPAPISTQPIPIHSPTPTTSVVSPQILNHEVITSLLGLPPSRSASAASYGSDVQSHTSSREGDNEYEESRGSNSGGRRGNLGSDGFSESSTVLDPEAELDEELQAAGASAGRPLLSVPAQRGDTRNPLVNGGTKVNGKGRVHGDVTPRAPVPASGINGHSTPSRGPIPPPMDELSRSTSTTRPSQSHQAQDRHPSGPFAAGSELWPYARPPVDDRAVEVDELEDGEIVELDFEDTSALSDPDAFRQVQQQRVRRNPDADSAPNASEGGSGAGGRERRDRGKGRKKGKRERAADRAASLADNVESARLFQLLDASVGASHYRSSSRSASASPSLEESPAQPPDVPVFSETETPTTARPSKIQMMMTAVNGSSSGAAARDSVAALEPERTRASLISIISARAQKPPAHLERNEFVREVLTLIHTDKAFVDALYRDYIARRD
ncbi:hypothetical protein C8R44DRAFT_988877 [Mycena epipterygia]|nr:hypothetical protein C8R44DRAFT_988877 [Mycena epipterygia]